MKSKMKDTSNVLELAIWLIAGILAGIGMILAWIDPYEYIKVIIVCLIAVIFGSLSQ